ncbi:MAG: beta-propeller fold lactonase family protein, partial [Rhodoferax sp.]|nr:beta-propeller fold lactonase family protein [Rhodoferax sp.]
MKLPAHRLLSTLFPILLSACGGGGDDGAGPVAVTVPTYNVSVAISGLAGSGLVLQLNGAADLPISATGTATFSTQLPDGAPYAITVASSPSLPAQRCTLDNPGGVVTATSIVSVAVVCRNIGRFAYSTNVGSNDVSIFAIDSATGALTQVGANVAAGAAPSDIAVSPSGRFAYVVNNTSNDVSAYAIDAATGALTSLGATAPTGNSPASITISPSGLFAYVANYSSASVSTYAIDPVTGLLSSTGAPIPAGTNSTA